MKQYFCAGLTPAQKSRLTRAGIPYLRRRLEGTAGCVFTEADIDTACTLLECQPGEEQETADPNLVRVELCGPEELIMRAPRLAAEPTVANRVSFARGTRRPCKAQTILETVEAVLGAHVPGRIIIHLPGKVVPPYQAQDFNIWIGSGALERFAVPITHESWGKPVFDDHPTPEFAYSGRGLAISCGNHRPVAEVIDNHLYILRFIGYRDYRFELAEDELALFTQILEEARRLVFPTAEERAAEYEESRQKYVRACSRRLEILSTELTGTLARKRADLLTRQTELVKLSREVQDMTVRLHAYQALRNDEEGKYAQEFDNLLQLPQVEAIEFPDENGFDVYTTILYCKNPETNLVHEIGKFKIEVFLDGLNEGVRWSNLTRRVDGIEKGMHAPHIFPDGSACLGTLEEVLPDLIARYEFSVVAQLAIQFVESVNMADQAGRHITRWPVAGG